jgi:hypothetical protein
MSLLRRAPREVYRVYREEEFFTAVTRIEQPEAELGGSGERWLRTVIGATLLLATAGALGSVIASASLHSSSGARRAGRASLVASTGSLVARARAHVHRRGEPRRKPAQPTRASDRRTRRRASSSRARGAGSVVAVVAAPSERALVELANVARMTPAATAGPRPFGRSEFGFER